MFYVPGEHDFVDDGEQYKQRFGKGAKGNGWYSYSHKGVHFVGLNNCVQVDAVGNMGSDQLAWLKADVGPGSERVRPEPARPRPACSSPRTPMPNEEDQESYDEFPSD